MKVYCLLLSVLLFSFESEAQLVQSNCTAKSNIIQFYQNDADRLVLSHYRAKNYSEKDSIPISPLHSDTLISKWFKKITPM
ncbi:MAG: hypothetical protein AB8B74_13760 [Crocinitomicaceae bacterium]